MYIGNVYTVYLTYHCSSNIQSLRGELGLGQLSLGLQLMGRVLVHLLYIILINPRSFGYLHPRFCDATVAQVQLAWANCRLD